MISAERITNTEYIFPAPHSELLLQASNLIASFARRGLMLAQTPADLSKIADRGHLVLATVNGEVIGSSAYTVQYKDGTWEFGAWAVRDDFQHNRQLRIGRHLLDTLVKGCDLPEKAIALANQEYSSPIFAKLGADLITNHSILDPEIFNPCKNCNCMVRSKLKPGRLCIDDIYDLTNVFRKIKTL